LTAECGVAAVVISGAVDVWDGHYGGILCPLSDFANRTIPDNGPNSRRTHEA